MKYEPPPLKRKRPKHSKEETSHAFLTHAPLNETPHSPSLTNSPPLYPPKTWEKEYIISNHPIPGKFHKRYWFWHNYGSSNDLVI